MTTPEGVADDLTGATFYAEIRQRSGAAVADISSAFTLRSGSQNVIDFDLNPAATWDLPGGSFVWDLLVEIAGVRTFVIPTESVLIATPSTRPEEL